MTLVSSNVQCMKPFERDDSDIMIQYTMNIALIEEPIKDSYALCHRLFVSMATELIHSRL